MGNELEQLSAEWIAAKSMESHAIKNRRAVEDKMLSMLGINIQEGVVKRDAGEFDVKITMRLTRKVDGNALSLAYKENKVPQWELDKLFRWKPELNLKEWKDASNEVKALLAPCITSEPGRPTFQITEGE